jgi:glycosyltransferase involved in cell wall biosynthesis
MNTHLFIITTRNFGGQEIMVISIIEECLLFSKKIAFAFCFEGSEVFLELNKLKKKHKIINNNLIVFECRSKFSFALKILRCLSRVKQGLVFFSTSIVSSEIFLPFILRLFSHCSICFYSPIIEPFKKIDLHLGSLKDFFLWRVCLPLLHFFIVLTNCQKLFLRKKGFKNKIFVLPNTVPSLFRNRSAVRIKHTFSPCIRMKILYIGRFDFLQKGLDIFLFFLSKYYADLRHHFSFSFVGSGDLLAQAKKYGLNNIPLKDKSFIRIKNWSNSKKEISQHHALIIPSRFEGVPLVMLEAMNSYVPVVASNLHGIKDYIHK